MATLVSHSKRFVFIHLPKCAGTSVSALLEGYAYPWLLSSKLARNAVHILGHWANIDLMDYTGKYILPLHADADLLVKRFPATDFAYYFRFAIVRSPWSLLVSLYEFNQRPRMRLSHPRRYCQRQDYSFHQFIKSRCPNCTHVNLVDHLFKHGDGTLDMDYVAKQESLDSDFRHILGLLDLPVRPVPRRNATKHHDYTRYYDDETLQIVGKAFERDIRAFGYAFGD